MFWKKNCICLNRSKLKQFFFLFRRAQFNRIQSILCLCEFYCKRWKKKMQKLHSRKIALHQHTHTKWIMECEHVIHICLVYSHVHSLNYMRHGIHDALKWKFIFLNPYDISGLVKFEIKSCTIIINIVLSLAYHYIIVSGDSDVIFVFSSRLSIVNPWRIKVIILFFDCYLRFELHFICLHVFHQTEWSGQLEIF